MIADFSALAVDLVELIRALELERAAQLAHAARRDAQRAHFEDRQQTVHALTLAIAAAKMQRTKLFDAVAALPPAEQSRARHAVDDICRVLFDEQIASMVTRKRQLSRPAR
ncbi:MULTISPECIES: hypothetical protein [unclassified Burkholderia]|uniref:hypothetical protein n=1 Tax=unclassified Burkholderia TaxID=2613784 RepID=UPI000F57D55E|nr:MULTISPECIES: hypothetical protein [unclassified Burkholderia]RQR46238.1 hypothetical protein DIE20_03590 [Burkholderia sp. Bp9131]RQR78600.1 hypothetical protein DIE12_02760 [Burkholderia sp. Bp9015]RQR81647.1 hypothetical protein DIE10_17015 [Burkholderia sp. Bp9011]RQR91347.1 hypothetical protein DIE09_19255 [Burkholderia sp. Bp9010]RQS40477.1 hypothetical protein DIE01_14200 [Burkholderia sp. Bp8990]